MYLTNGASFVCISNPSILSSNKIGVLLGLDDRQEEDNLLKGKIAIGIFDEIIIKQNGNLHGKDELKYDIKALKPNYTPKEISN